MKEIILLIFGAISAFCLTALAIPKYADKIREWPKNKYVLFSITIVAIAIFLPLLNYFIQVDSKKELILEQSITEALSNVTPAVQQRIVEDINALRKEINKTGEVNITKRDRAIKMWRLSSNAIRNNDRDKALYYIDLSLKCVNTGVAHSFKGLLLESTNPKDALKEYKWGLELNPEYAEGYNNIAAFYSTKLNDIENAEKGYRNAIKYNPNYAKAYNNLSCILIKKNKDAEALEYLFTAIKIDPSYSDTYHNIGIVYSKAGKYKDAEKYYLKAISCNQQISIYYVALALCYVNVGKTERAIDYLEKAVKIGYNDYNITPANKYVKSYAA
jgi:tetratricopeptide (TPR) repeat protein